ncbi:retrovirus-related pol polyprotein from transposon TNT 1-94 [Tanacetum coccineum]
MDDYSRFTWVKFLRSKDETLEFIIKFLNKIQVRLNDTVRNIRTDSGTEFVNHALRSFYEDVRISHQTSVARTPQQNGVDKRRIQTYVEVARTMLIFSKASLCMWAKNTRFKVFSCLWCPVLPKNDNEDLGKLKPKADIGIFIVYSLVKKEYRIYNRRTTSIMETIYVEIDELTAMAYEQFSSGPELQLMTPGTINVNNLSSSTPYIPSTKKDWDILFQPMFDEYFQPSPSVVSHVLPTVALIPANTTGTPKPKKKVIEDPENKRLKNRKDSLKADKSKLLSLEVNLSLIGYKTSSVSGLNLERSFIPYLE